MGEKSGNHTYSKTIQVPELIEKCLEGGKNRGFRNNLIFWVFLLMLLEGFDFIGIAYIAPSLIKEWHMNPATFGTIVSVGFVGVMIGNVLLGILGDRIGRKKAIVVSVLIFGLLTLVTTMANSPNVLMLLRFLAGIGLGGTLPLAMVLVDEYAPKKSRSKWVAWAFAGFPTGLFLGGLLASWLVPHLGWRALFTVGGVLPLIILLGVAFRLPESLRYLVVKNKDHSQIAKIVSMLNADITIDSETQFIFGTEKPSVKFSLNKMFIGVLAWVTPLLFLFAIVNSLVVSFLTSWMPNLFVTSGLSLSHAALATALYHLAGIFCNIVVGWVLDKRGLIAAVIFPVIAVVATALLGIPMSTGLFIIVLFVSGFSVIGTQFVLTTMGPKLFPTAYRSSANGILQAVGFIGTIGGPIIGGALIGAKLSVKELFLVNSGLLVISAILLLLMGLSYRRQFVLEKKATSEGYASPGN
jgi:AAHS family 4-hydroxybenzoate transporter-like MFS transporter